MRDNSVTGRLCYFMWHTIVVICTRLELHSKGFLPWNALSVLRWPKMAAISNNDQKWLNICRDHECICVGALDLSFLWSIAYCSLLSNRNCSSGIHLSLPTIHINWNQVTKTNNTSTQHCASSSEWKRIFIKFSPPQWHRVHLVFIWVWKILS